MFVVVCLLFILCVRSAPSPPLLLTALDTPESASPEHSTSGSRHKAEMNEAINSLTSEMVRSCHMSSYYMKWRTNGDEDEAIVRALAGGGSASRSSSRSAAGGAGGGGGIGGSGAVGRTSRTLVTQSMSRSEQNESLRTTTATTTTTTVVRVQQDATSDNKMKIVEGHIGDRDDSRE